MKRTLIALAVASAVLGTTAFAGGGAVAPSHSNIYVEGNVGAAYRGIFQGYSEPAGIKHANWAWTLGVDLGYSFNEYLAAEVGGFWVEPVSYPAVGANPASEWTNWIGYLAGRISAPVGDHFDVFGKLGFAANRAISNLDRANRSTGISPMIAVGGAYNISPNLYMNVQYALLGRSWNSVAGVPKAPEIQLITLGIGYKIPM